jgi:predicted small metal-binding protein
MGKIIHCGDLFPGCGYVARGHDDTAALISIVEHLTAEHDLRDVNDDLLHRAQGVMRDIASGGVNQ